MSEQIREQVSEQIREQVSAFLDGELPGNETELLLKRLTRDADLRGSFGRYAVIGEACRGTKNINLRVDLCARISSELDGYAASSVAAARIGVAGRPHWWRPFAGVTVAAGVAVVAVFALQQRAHTPALASAPTTTAGGVVAANGPNLRPVATAPAVVTAPMLAGVAAGSREPVSYTTPSGLTEPTASFATARLTNYVFAHSKYPSLLGQRDVLTDLIVESDEPAPTAAPEKAP
jgi:negative regulator of sigma E activity